MLTANFRSVAQLASVNVDNEILINKKGEDNFVTKDKPLQLWGIESCLAQLAFHRPEGYEHVSCPQETA